jgi:Asp-tRNA(Asn)/Glu-tRNA(Gln) amidotransferase A subunit family amidase
VLRDLSDAIRTRRVSARELVTRSLERIERLDPGFGAVVGLRDEEALAEAESLDERVAGGEDPRPLAGLPLLVKDIEDVRGMRTTHGSDLFRDAAPAERDGVIVSRLRAAGAITVGKTNTPEFAAEGFSANGVFGATRNPWAPEWSPGGSSGGSGAAVAAGMAPIATATDTGGSIRIPAAYCGLVGIKPTKGVVVWDTSLCWPDLTTCGPLATDVDDLRLLLQVEAEGMPSALASGGLPRRVIALPRVFDWGPLPASIAELFRSALEVLDGELSLPVEPMEPGDLIRAGNAEETWVSLTAPELVQWLGRTRADESLDRLYPTTRSFVEVGLATPFDEYMQARRRCAEFGRELGTVLSRDTLIAMPTLAAEGWLADGRMAEGEEPGPPPEVYNVSIANLTGLPAITVPAGRSPNGVPFGLQLIAPRFGDAMLLDLADAWHGVRPWPRSAEGYEPFDS